MVGRQFTGKLGAPFHAAALAVGLTDRQERTAPENSVKYAAFVPVIVTSQFRKGVVCGEDDRYKPIC
jgi:hypothetical protein